MATHEERIQALEDLIPGIARSQEMMVEALGAISEAMRGIVRTQHEHSAILQEHSAILQTHSTVLRGIVETLDEHTAILMEHTTLLRSIVSTVQEHSLELARIRGNMALD